MKKTAVLFLCAFLLVLHACKKKDTTTTPTPTPTVAHPYYFKFTFNGLNKNFNSNQPQYIFLYTNETGGYQGEKDLDIFPSVGLSLNWPIGDTVHESDLMGLIGKTLYFNDTAIRPEITYDIDASATNYWTSVDTSNTKFNVTITNVTFLKNDTTMGYWVKSYVLSGTCSALMSKDGETSILSDATFHFIIAKRDL